MSSSVSPLRLFSFLALSLLILGATAALRGGLMIDGHEGDTLHLIEILLRIDAGEWPHKDFMTPIGILAFAPINLFMKLGNGIGAAFIHANILVAALLLPMLWWATWSRLRGGMAYLLGFYVIVLVMALVYGGASPTIAVSMHYNRWAWGIAHVAVLLAVLPPHNHARPVLDGVLIGLSLAALALIKVTYFLALAPVLALALALRKCWRGLLSGLIAGLAVAAFMTFLAGPGYWLAYMNDLLVVSQSQVRPEPGHAFTDILSAPEFVAGTALMLLAVVLLRQIGCKYEGLLLLLLLPGFAYITYQNFGNDPQWLLLFAALLFAFRPASGTANRWGWDAHSLFNLAIAAVLALSSASFFNMATSPFRLLAKERGEYTPLLGRNSPHDDILMRKERVLPVVGRTTLEIPGLDLALYGVEDSGSGNGKDETATLMGEVLQDCELEGGLEIWLTAMTRDIEQAGLARNKRILAADLISSHWLFSRQLLPLRGGAPWYYGGLPGIESADYLLVPQCPLLRRARRMILEEIDKADQITLRELRRTSYYILLEIRRE